MVVNIDIANMMTSDDTTINNTGLLIYDEEGISAPASAAMHSFRHNFARQHEHFITAQDVALDAEG